MHTQFENYNRQTHHKQTHIYLFAWQGNEDDYLSQLVYRLKSDNSILALNHYSHILSEKIKLSINNNEYNAVVPIPSARAGSTHANHIANVVSKKLNLPVLDILVKYSGEKQQKHLTRSERINAHKFELVAVPSEEFTKYIFVDDILTTGESFKQCSELLSQSQNNVIATLFFRESLI